MSQGPRHQRTQVQITEACDRVVTERSGCVIVIGRSSVNQTPGLPPRLYFMQMGMVWWYPRTDRGRLSESACTFISLSRAVGQLVGAGDESALAEMIDAASQNLQAGQQVCRELVSTVMARGIW